MLQGKSFLVIGLILLTTASAAPAANDFPYGNITLRVPGAQDPLPGLGNNHSALSYGIDTVLWNPAGLGKIKNSEFGLGLSSTAATPPYLKTYDVKDATFEVSGNNTGFNNTVLFTADPYATIATTREYTGHLNYSTVSSGIDYRQAIKVGDIFSFGVTTRGETGASLDLAGDFPAQWKSDIDLMNVNNFMGSGISTNNGRFSYTYKPAGGTQYTYTSEASVWSGFLNQSQRIPFTMISDSHNDIDVHSDVTLTGAARWQGLSVGANITPVSATANIDNAARVIVKEGTGDIYFYVPNFNPNNEASVLQWVTDPDQYGTSAGYTKRYFRVPAGETVAEGRYQGFYSASALKLDLGAIYDAGNILSLSLAMENVNGASLDFKGSGRVAYVTSRINTNESGSVIDPAGGSFNFFSDTFSTPSGVPDNLGMLGDVPVTLPQRTRIGAALRKPFLIALDYEMQNNPISFQYQDANQNYVTANIGDIRFLRGAFETQLFVLPVWFRGGLTAMLKPTLGGAVDQKTVDSFDKAFKFGLLPMKLDLGSNIGLSGYELGGAFGINLLPFIYALELDTLNSDFSRINYSSIYLKKDWWKVTYSSVLDPGSTAVAYSGLSSSDKGNLDFGKVMSVLKFVDTLTISFQF
ncbi:MAG TPA: hypothetical protein VMD02_00415 [Candidatus Omnitrophota bacterium]|nr:hypothetical protein [Candidatus Omnitrophota bacterium]